jgi:hypothetical protein
MQPMLPEGELGRLDLTPQKKTRQCGHRRA